MKNKILKLYLYFVSFFILIFLISNTTLSSEINLKAENIETIDKNLVKASGNIIIEDESGLEITGENLEANNLKGKYIIENNVVIKDSIRNLLIKSNKIILNKKSNVIKSIGLTEIEAKNNLSILSSDITFDRKNEIIFTDKESELKDVNFNTLIIKNLRISLNDNSLRSDAGTLIDKELNEFEIKNIYYDFSKKEILGQDIDLNNNNELDKAYLPRMKGKSFFYNENNVKVNKSVFTNCKKRDGCPQWHLKAEEITHDKKNKTVNYKNAWLNLYDVPVFYFPKFFHPDPTVKRKSGFLIPSFAQTNNSGNYLNVPYFFALAENRDFTFTPRFYSDNKVVYQGEYRHYTENSQSILDASVKNENILLLDNESTNSHFFLKSSMISDNSLFDFSELQFQLQSTSSDNYLKSYNLKSPLINSQTTLNSKILFEGISENIDFSFSTEVYEDLTKSNDSDRYEFIFPNFNLTRDLETEFSGNLQVNHSGYNKLYETNKSENVLINDISYKSNDKISNQGFVSNYEFLFKNFNVNSNNSKKYKNELENDLSGIFQFNSRLPLEKKGIRFNSTLSPIFVAKFSPKNTKNLRSASNLIDYKNIYSINRIGSNETVEGGESITFGNEFSLFDTNYNQKEIFSFNLATSFRNERNESLSDKSSLGQKTSNIVGQMKINTHELYDLEYDFLADNNVRDLNYHKISSKFKINNFVSTFEFLEENNPIGSNSYISNETLLKIDDNKDLKFKTRKNKKTDLTEYYNLIYQYKMDCLVAGIEYKKDYYNDVGVKPSEKIYFSITIMPFQNSIDLPGIKK